MKIALITYAEGPQWRGAIKRFASYSKHKIFDNVFVANQKWLLENSSKFRLHIKFIDRHPKGKGLWLWKPFLIETFFEKFPQYDVVIYSDVGSELNLNDQSEKRLIEYLNLVKRQNVVGFQLDLPEYRYTDPILNSIYRSTIDTTTGQIMATIILFKKSEIANQFISEWQKVAVRDQYKFLTGGATTEATKGASNFEHRHDQSIFSYIYKSRGWTAIPDETYFAPEWRRKGKIFPFWAARNRNRISVCSFLVFRKVEAIYRKVSIMCLTS
jgi:hypothetical protein